MAGLARSIIEFYNAILHDHIAGQKFLESIHVVPGQTIERVPHRSPIRVQTIFNSAVAHCIITGARSILHDLIIVEVGNHHEKLTLPSFRGPLRYEHMLRPTAPAEIELGQGVSANWSAQIQIPESPFEWDGDGGFGGIPRNVVITLTNCELK